MPAKKKPIKKSIKTKAIKKPMKMVMKVAKKMTSAKAKSQTEKNKRAPKPMAAKKPHASGGNIFWKVLEMRKQERETRKLGPAQYDSKDPRHVHNDKHSRFARFAGPRRRAA